MKQKGIFIGTSLIGFGLYFLLESWQFSYMDWLYRWPTYFLIFGFGFLFQSTFKKDHSSIFPAILMLGLGIHFHMAFMLSYWPTKWAVYPLLFGLAFLIHYIKTKQEGLIIGIILVFCSILALFSTGYVNGVDTIITLIEKFWPIVFIILGLYYIVKKK